MRAYLILPLVTALLVAPVAHSEDTHVALVKNVTGTITIVRNGSRMKAESGTELEKSDEVLSDVGATAGVVFRDGTLLTIGSGSDLQIRDYVFEPKEAQYAFSVYLAKGSAIYSSGKIGKISPQSVSVATPKAVIGVRGTRFLVTATE